MKVRLRKITVVFRCVVFRMTLKARKQAYLFFNKVRASSKIFYSVLIRNGHEGENYFILDPFPALFCLSSWCKGSPSDTTLLTPNQIQ